jgi:hypothetical protein
VISSGFRFDSPLTGVGAAFRTMKIIRSLGLGAESDSA